MTGDLHRKTPSNSVMKATISNEIETTARNETEASDDVATANHLGHVKAVLTLLIHTTDHERDPQVSNSAATNKDTMSVALQEIDGNTTNLMRIRDTGHQALTEEITNLSTGQTTGPLDGTQTITKGTIITDPDQLPATTTAETTTEGITPGHPVDILSFCQV